MANILEQENTVIEFIEFAEGALGRTDYDAHQQAAIVAMLQMLKVLFVAKLTMSDLMQNFDQGNAPDSAV